MESIEMIGSESQRNVIQLSCSSESISEGQTETSTYKLSKVQAVLHEECRYSGPRKTNDQEDGFRSISFAELKLDDNEELRCEPDCCRESASGGNMTHFITASYALGV